MSHTSSSDLVSSYWGVFLLVVIARSRGQRVVTASQRYTALREQQEEEDDNITV